MLKKALLSVLLFLGLSLPQVAYCTELTPSQMTNPELLSRLKTNLTQLETINSRQEQDLVTLNQQIETLQKELTELRSKRDLLESKLKLCIASNAKAQSSLENANKLLTSLSEEADKKNKTIKKQNIIIGILGTGLVCAIVRR